MVCCMLDCAEQSDSLASTGFKYAAAKQRKCFSSVDWAARLLLVLSTSSADNLKACWLPLPPHAACRPVQEAAAALHSTATLIMQRAAKPEPPATWLLYDLAGAIGSDYDMAAQSIRALHAAACSAEGPTTRGMRTAFLPLQLASWDAAALPAELQPYAAHFRAALSLW